MARSYRHSGNSIVKDNAMNRLRRRFQFSLRTLFVLTVVVSIPLAWVGYSLSWIRQRREVLAGARVWDTSSFSSNVRRTAPAGLWLLGETGVNDVTLLPGSSLDTKELKRLFPEAEIVDWRNL